MKRRRDNSLRGDENNNGDSSTLKIPDRDRKIIPGHDTSFFVLFYTLVLFN